MRFIVDECAGPAVSDWLMALGHYVVCVRKSAKGSSDNQVIDRAFHENRVLITIDKDFGEKIYRERRPHRGVVLLCLEDERNTNKILVLGRLFAKYSEELVDRFVTVTENRVRFAARQADMNSE